MILPIPNTVTQMLWSRQEEILHGTHVAGIVVSLEVTI
jgi:hypothetical protein